MQGKMIVIRPDSPEAEVTVFAGPPLQVEVLQAAVGGYIETVPYWHHYYTSGEWVRCVAFCNEHGKIEGMPVNYAATAKWRGALARDHQPPIDDYLVGSVAVVIGDPEFMDEL